MSINIEQYKCPTCDGYIPNNENIGAYSGAISRTDNETEVCSDCGTREALGDFIKVTATNNLPKTFDELMSKVLAFLPEATLDEDEDGQIYINTNLTERNGRLEDMGDINA